VVAPTRLSQYAWPAAAALAAGFIGVLALHGGRPEPGLTRFEPAGVLSDWQPREVVAVEVGSAAGRRAFRRDADGGWRIEPSDEAPAAALTEQIELGLKLLHNSAPQRTDLDSAQLAEFGLQPPHLTVLVAAANGAGRTIEFGGANPLGLERYARIGGKAEVMLLPSFVADAWESVAAR
jgi:hypothetical protein